MFKVGNVLIVLRGAVSVTCKKHLIRRLNKMNMMFIVQVVRKDMQNIVIRKIQK